MYRIILVLLTLLPVTALTAQSLFNVRVGTFKEVKSDDFAEIQDLGFVSGVARDGNLTDVFIGSYTSEEKAQTVVDQLTGKGFRNASVQRQILIGSRNETFVQIALRGRNRSFDWPKLQSAGPLYVEATDAVVKVLAGPFTSDAEAGIALTKVRGMGFTDAFTKKVDVARLIPVGVFETGIKKPLIPIELNKTAPIIAAGPVAAAPTVSAPASAPPTVTPPAPTTSTSATKLTLTGENALAAEETTVETPAADPRVDLPEIDVKTKRHSAAELQRVLKEKGYYNSSVDGYYGEGTRAAYQTAWQRMPELENYRRLADAPAIGGLEPDNWPEMRVLTVIAGDLAAGQGNTGVSKEMSAARKKLLTASAPLGAATVKKAAQWEETIWKNLDVWATKDPLHARIITALRVSYYQSQVRLEAMYLGEGMTAIQAKDMATAALENSLRGPLDRFL